VKTSLFGVLFLLVSVSSLFASAAPGPAPDKRGVADYDTVELQGCLERAEGHFILVDKSNTYERLSDTSKLRKLIGHEIKVTGTRATKTLDTTQWGAASTAKEIRYIEVKSVTDMAPNCQEYGR
jgi:hypothetical protein